MTNIIKGKSKAEKAAVEAKIKDLANTFDSKGVKATGMPHIPIPDHLKGSSKKEDGIVGYF
jgi:hypothetical protein